MCVEAVQCCNAIMDPVLLQDNRVLENMLKAEDLYLPNAALFNQSQAEVQPYMRKIVAEWMLEVCILTFLALLFLLIKFISLVEM